MAHIRQFRPDYGFDCQVKSLKPLKWLPLRSQASTLPPALKIRPNLPISDLRSTLSDPPKRDGCRGESEVWDLFVWSLGESWWEASADVKDGRNGWKRYIWFAWVTL